MQQGGYGAAPRPAAQAAYAAPQVRPELPYWACSLAFGPAAGV